MFDPEEDLKRKNDAVHDFFDAQKSHLDLNSDMLKGDLGIADYVLESVSYDTVVLSMVDQEGGLKKEGKFLFSADTDIKAWRRGIVKMVGPCVTSYKVGDMVLFPGVKGLATGIINVRMPDKSVEKVEAGHFIAEPCIHGTLGVMTPDK